MPATESGILKKGVEIRYADSVRAGRRERLGWEMPICDPAKDGLAMDRAALRGLGDARERVVWLNRVGTGGYIVGHATQANRTLDEPRPRIISLQEAMLW